MKKCPYCQAEVDHDAAMCHHCGRGRVAAVRAEAAVRPPSVSESCLYCQGIVDRTDKTCPHCQRRLTGRALLENPPSMIVPPKNDLRVSVIDVDMPFGSMVSFMVKWAVASIPAFLIIFGVCLCVGILLGVMFGVVSSVGH